MEKQLKRRYKVVTVSMDGAPAAADETAIFRAWVSDSLARTGASPSAVGLRSGVSKNHLGAWLNSTRGITLENALSVEKLLYECATEKGVLLSSVGALRGGPDV
jgi:hypothetical protein